MLGRQEPETPVASHKDGFQQLQLYLVRVFLGMKHASLRVTRAEVKVAVYLVSPIFHI